MNSCKHNMKRRLAICLAAMALTWGVILLLMVEFGLTPFGNDSLAAADCKIQYLDFFNYYKDVLSGKNRIGYTLTKELGSNAVGVFSYYLSSPLSVLIGLFDSTQMNEAVDLLIFLKLGLAAGTFAYFLQARLYDRLSPLFTILLSVGYGLNHYSFANGHNLMWLDGMLLLPLMLLGTHLVVRRRSLAPLAVPTALSIYANWYTGGINCLFCIIWLVFEFVLNELDPETGSGVPASNICGAAAPGAGGVAKRLLGTIVRYGSAMVLGIMISAALFLPTVAALQQGRGSGFYLQSYMKNVFNGNILDTITQYRVDGYSDKTAVSLYSGSLAVIGMFSLFFTHRVRICQKIAAAALLAVTMLTYYWQPLFFIFSLLKRVDSYVSRYGYIGSVVFLFLAALYLQHVFPSREAAAEEERQNGKMRWAEYILPLCSGALFCVLLFAVGKFTPEELAGPKYTCLTMLGAGLCTSALLVLRSAGGKSLRPAGDPAQRSAGDPAHRSAGSRNKRRIAAGVAAALLTVISLAELHRSGQELVRHNRLRDVERYAAYVTESKEQVKTLKEYDGGLYRISQIGWRGMNDESLHTTAYYNDALAYNYMGISGYTSCPENDQMYLLQRLGYKEDNLTMNIVNTSFVPADSMLGVRYVFSDTDIPGMHKLEQLGTYNNRDTYYNPCALPLAFPYDGSMLPDHEYHDPFEYLEEIWTAFSGEEAHIFTSLERVKTVTEGTITWELKVPEGNVGLYGNLPVYDDGEIPGILQAGTADPIGYSQWLGPKVFTIPVEEGAETANVTMTSEYNFVAVDEEFFALDFDRLQELADKINKKAEQVSDLSMENGKVSCTVTAREGESLFLNLPRTKGWNTYVNGEKVETEEFAYCLTVIPLTEGENRIEMSYRVPNLRRGIALTVAGLVLLVAYEWWTKRPLR